MAKNLTQDVQGVVLTLMEGLNCPRSLTVAILVRYEEWDQLTQLETDPRAYCDADRYLDAISASEFLRKFKCFELDIDLEAAAIGKWWWAEKQCFHTNRRLDSLLGWGPFGGPAYGEAMAKFVSSFRENVEWLIGSGPNPVADGRFGPGATVSDSSRMTTVPDKMSSVPTLTPSALGYLVPWTGTHWATACAELGNSPSFVRGNTFFTVDKTARSRRSCGKEPSLNVYYQLGLGRDMRRRLKSRGIDLDDGQTVHRQVACSASYSGEFVTIDLSSASDCVSTSLVELVLPHRWHRALSDLRSPFTEVEGRQIRLEKFSSMGNGYTFELETTLFAALVMTCMRGTGIPGVNMWVYGDDIIAPTEYSEDILAALKFFGFTPNPNKTFTEGVFRESCGGDYFLGTAVRPHYLKDDPDEPQKIISLANGIRRMAFQGSDPTSRWRRLRRAWFRCLDLLPTSIRRCRGPRDLGDIVIHDEEASWETRWRSSIRFVRAYRPATYKKVMWEGFAYDVQFAAALYGVSLQDSSKGDWWRQKRYLVPRDGVMGYKVGWVPFS